MSLPEETIVPIRFSLALIVLAGVVLGTSSAHADRCDELAKQLARQIDGLTVGKAVAGTITLSHPATRQMSLGCAARNKMNEIFAASDKKKPPKEFFEVVASAAALIFTIPKNDALRGSNRCAGRIGFFRGSNIVTRYRKLDIRCNGTPKGTTISISREKDI